MRIQRIVIDECVRQDSPLLAQLTERLCGHLAELVFLAAQHPGIPDVEILDKLLDGRTALLTHAQQPYSTRSATISEVAIRMLRGVFGHSTKSRNKAGSRSWRSNG